MEIKEEMTLIEPQNYHDDMMPYNMREQCSVCGLEDSTIIELHHRIPQAINGSDDISNLEPLCPNCHSIIHYEIKILISNFLCKSIEDGKIERLHDIHGAELDAIKFDMEINRFNNQATQTQG